MSHIQTFAILGMGNGGHAFAAYLGLRGQTVQAWDVEPALIEQLRAVGTVSAEGNGLAGTTTIDVLTPHLEDAVAGADVILVVIPAIYHAAVAHQLAPHVVEGQLIILNPGATGGALEFQEILRNRGATRVVVAETNNMLFTCRSDTPGSVTVNAIKEKLHFACVPAAKTLDAYERIRSTFPQFSPAPNVLHTSLTNINAMVHPLPTVLNAARCDGGPPFEYYHDGITPAVAATVERLDDERVRVANALGANVQTLAEWYTESYGRPVATLYEAVQENPAYNGIKGPSNLRTRYLMEDVATGLVPLAELGRAADVPTPLTDAVIQLASSLVDTNFAEQGRTLAKLGLSGLTVDQIAKALG